MRRARSSRVSSSRCAPHFPLGPDGRRRTSGGVSIRRGSPRGGDLSVELASRRHRDDPTRARSRGLPMNLSSVIVLLGVAADGWLLAFLAIRGRRPWLQSTFAACALSFLVVGAWSAARNEGVLPAVREDLVLGLMLLTPALTALLVLGLIHGEALPRRRAVRRAEPRPVEFGGPMRSCSTNDVRSTRCGPRRRKPGRTGRP